MSQWGGTNSLTKPKARNYSSLDEAVRWLSPEAKQAMYAAAKGNLIKRGTWKGCAFNKAGTVAGTAVSSVNVAADAFKMPAKSVVRFINVWDSLKGTDQFCTNELVKALERIGIYGARGTRKNFSLLVYTPEMRKHEEMERELQKMIEDGKAEDVEFAKEVADLLANNQEAFA